MNLNEIRLLADDDSVEVKLTQPDNGIGRVTFKLCGIEMKTQFDIDNAGLYAPNFDCWSNDIVFEFLERAKRAIERDENAIADDIASAAIEIADDAAVNLIQSHCKVVSIAPHAIGPGQINPRTGYDLDSIEEDTKIEPDLTYALKRGLIARVPKSPNYDWSSIVYIVQDGDDDLATDDAKESDDGS